MVNSGAPDRPAAHDLPRLAMSVPLTAEAEARAVLSSRSSPEARTFALQALGIVARERGQTSMAIRHLRLAVTEAERAGNRARRADVLASLGTALAGAGRRAATLDAFDAALGDSRGVATAHVLVRRCAALLMFGDDDAAYADARRAARILNKSGDALWEARARNNAAHALLGLGRFSEADSEYARAQELAESTGQLYDAALIAHSRGDCAYRLGDLPRALELLYSARDRYARLGVTPTDAQRDLVKVLLAAGLTAEATAAADELVVTLEADRGPSLARADGLGVAAGAYLVAGDAVSALGLARRARRAYERQGHRDGARASRLIELQARAATEPPSARLATSAVHLAAEMRDRHAAERLDALLLAGGLAQAAGRSEDARSCWVAASAHRSQGSALRRAGGWLATSQLAGLQRERGRLLRACDAGLDVLEGHRRSLGSTELQARATAHGRDLAALAVREVLRSGTGRDLLRWTERWRATVLDRPSGRVTDDPDELRDLAALRKLTLDGTETGTDATAADRERARLEEQIRRRAHTRAGSRRPSGAPASVDEVVSSLQPGAALVAIARVDGTAHVVVARHGRVRRFQAGDGRAIDEAAEFARFALRSAATGNEVTAAAMVAALEDQAGRLQELLLGPAVRAIGEGPVVVVPPARLQSIPWDALPALRDRPVSVSPSASAWLRSCRATRPRRRGVALVTGPRLESAGAEVPDLARSYDAATVLGDGTATCEAVMSALDGAWLAHVAAHGTIRTDNPMFSALELDDGPLTVYDLERLRRAPYRLVLSVCESAVGAATGADELLGLSSALIGLGTAGLLASIVPVNDEATVPFSLTIHERLRAGDDLATALMHARRAAGDDPVARATAYSFLALGAA